MNTQNRLYQEPMDLKVVRLRQKEGVHAVTAYFFDAVYLGWHTLLFAIVFIFMAANPPILNEYLSSTSLHNCSHNGVHVISIIKEIKKDKVSPRG